jgi:outer membrane receptor protein involved in Fe transport
MRRLKKTDLRNGLAAGVAFAALTVASLAHAEPRYAFNLAPASMADSVRSVGRITGSNVLFDPRVAENLQAPPLKGEMTAAEALAALLAGSDLIVHQMDAHSIYITRNPGGPAAKPVKIAQEGAFRVAQAAPPPAAQIAPPPEPTEELSEIVVTATKQADTVGRVPISITAVSQQTLERQGAKNIQDLVRTIPALTVQRNGADFSPTIAIRGIYSAAGSPTTGVYLDDVALQKRNVSGVSGNGSPVPQLFDLERVEVLRGPQGTLYGGSSVGGTVRFITPQPSLTRYSAYARAEASTTEGGDPSYEGGVAMGGPIVQDRLGFRGSFWARETGGYIDHLDVFTAKPYADNVNSGDSYAGRLAVLWAPTDRLQITPAFYYSHDHQDDVDTYWLKVEQATTAAVTRAATTRFPAFTYPSHTYGPYTQFGKFRSGNPYRSPRSTDLALSSLSVDYDLGFMSVKSVTAYVRDVTRGVVDEAGFSGEARNLQGGVGFIAELPNFRRQFTFNNARTGVTQELRFTSPDKDAKLSWVAGLYYNNSQVTGTNYIFEDLDLLSSVMRGADAATVYGAPMLPGNLAGGGSQTLKDRSKAGFAELYYRITDKLKLTAGARIEDSWLGYSARSQGASLSGFAAPTLQNGGLSVGEQSEKATTPKLNLTYQISPTDMVYLSAAKGFRPGGVNRNISLTSCATGLAVYGGPPPSTYGSDSVWSYEAGAKLNWRSKAQLNASVFYIDWNGPQIAQTFPGCSAAFTVNAGKAVSKGFDLQAQVRPIRSLTVNLSLGYTDAYYSEAILGPTPVPGATRAILTNKGDELPIAPLVYNVGFQYDFDLVQRSSYVRFDYQFASRYHRTTGPGTVSYAPDVYNAESVSYATLRAGMRLGDWEVAAFANNLFNASDALSLTGGRGTCRNLACSSYAINEPQFIASSYRPRTIGLSASFRY